MLICFVSLVVTQSRRPAARLNCSEESSTRSAGLADVNGDGLDDLTDPTDSGDLGSADDDHGIEWPGWLDPDRDEDDRSADDGPRKGPK